MSFMSKIKGHYQVTATDDLGYLTRFCKECNRVWKANEHLEWSDAEDLVGLLKEMKNLPKNTKSVADAILKYAKANDDWDSGEVANWPNDILKALKKDGMK